MKQKRLVVLERKVVYNDWDRVAVIEDIDSGKWDYECVFYHNLQAKLLMWHLVKNGVAAKVKNHGLGIKSIIPGE